MSHIKAEMRLPTQELRKDIPFYTKVLGMRMDSIYPADDPQVAVFSGHGLRLRIENGAAEPPGTLRILTETPDAFADGKRHLTAPNGTQIEIDDLMAPEHRDQSCASQIWSEGYGYLAIATHDQDHPNAEDCAHCGRQ